MKKYWPIWIALLISIPFSWWWISDLEAARIGTRSAQVQGATVSMIETVVSSSTNVTASATTQIIEMDATGGARGVELPAANTTTGMTYKIKKVDASTNVVTVTVAGGGLIGNATSYRLTRQFSTISVTSNGTKYVSGVPSNYQNVDPKEFGATGDGATDDSGALQDANDGSSGEEVVIPPGDYAIDTNVTFSSPVVIEPGALLALDVGVVVTFEGTLDAPYDVQIFSVSATDQVVFDTDVEQEYVSPIWFGATPNDGTDDTAAVEYAEDAAEDNGWATLIFPPGVLNIEDPIDFDPNVYFLPGAMLDPGAGDTITFDGPVEAPQNQIVDTTDGDGTVVFSNGSTEIVLPVWMGADPVDNANDDTDAIQDAIDAGATNIKRIEIPAGVYDLLSDLDFSDTLVEMGPGAIFEIGDGATLTVGSGHLIAGAYQIFTTTGTGKVEFDGDAILEVLPQWWGADGSDATDDTAAIQASVTAAASAGGGTVFFCPGTYVVTSVVGTTTSGIVVPPNIRLEISPGTIIQDDGDYVTIELNGDGTVFSGGIFGKNAIIRNADDTGSATIAILLQDCRYADVEFGEIRGDYSTAGVKLQADDGEVNYFNKITGYIPGNSGNAPATGVLFDTAGTAYNNGNEIDVAVKGGTTGIDIQGASSTNIIKSPDIAGLTNGVIIGDGVNSADYNILMYPRFENITNFSVEFKTGADYNQWLMRCSTILQANYEDGGTYNLVIGPNHDSGRSPVAYKTFTANPIIVGAASSENIVHFSAAANRHVRVYSGGVCLQDGTTAAAYQIELYNVTDAASVHIISNTKTSRGGPLAEDVNAVGKAYVVRLNNTSGGAQTLCGWITVSIDGE